MAKRTKTRDRKRQKKQRQKKFQALSFKKTILSKILKWYDPMLKQICSPVEVDEDISGLIKNMYRAITYSKFGVGLAAPQIGVAKNVIAVLFDRANIRFLVNPQIISYSDEKTSNMEGCLSFPGVEMLVERSISITVKYEDEKRIKREEEFKGFNSVVIQHEVDHLFGICYVRNKWFKDNPEPRQSSTSAKIKTEA